jgi:hypothetical protein
LKPFVEGAKPDRNSTKNAQQAKSEKAQLNIKVIANKLPEVIRTKNNNNN